MFNNLSFGVIILCDILNIHYLTFKCIIRNCKSIVELHCANLHNETLYIIDVRKRSRTKKNKEKMYEIINIYGK